MDIRSSAQLLLKDAGYSTSTWRDSSGPILRFEDLSVIGFLYEFASIDDLLTTCAAREKAVLTAHAPALRAAGVKAWNIYSVFLTSEVNTNRSHSISALDENLQTTRKLARAGLSTEATLRSALLPLLPILSQPQIAIDDYERRVKSALGNLGNGTIATSFFGPMLPSELLSDLHRLS